MSMYRIALPFPSPQKKLYCSVAVISLRISWETYNQEEHTAGGASRLAVVEWEGEKRSCCDGHTGGIVCGSATIKTEQDNH